jgi:hypothetical protein
VCLHVYASAQDLAHISMHLGWSCHVSACVCKHQRLWMYLHTMAGVCTHRAEHLPAFVGLYQGDEHEFAFLAFACSCMHLCVQSSSYVTMYQVLGMYPRCMYLHVSVYIKGCVSSCIEGVKCFCMCKHVSRAGHVFAYVGTFQELSVSAGILSWHDLCATVFACIDR